MTATDSQATANTKRKPRIAYLFSRYPVVSHTFCDNEILGLEAMGYEVVVASVHPPKNDFRHPRLLGLDAPVVYCPPPAVVDVLGDEAKKSERWPKSTIAAHLARFPDSTQPEERALNALPLAEALQRLNVDHVHLHFANRATHTAIFLKELSGITYSFTPQAQDFLIDLETPDLLVEFCANAEFVVAPCDFARQKLVEMCPDSADKLVTIYNGIDPSGYAQAAPNPRDGVLRILSVGRLIEFKGFHHLIAAIGKAKDSGVRVELEIMGDGPWMDQLAAQVKELGLGDRISFLGTVTLDQMKAGFERVDVFVLACTYGPHGAMDMFPTVITEAMLSGLPVISTTLAGVPELVANGETGLLTTPGDEDELAAALIRLATEEGLAASMGAKGLNRALSKFAIDVTLPQLAAEFERVVESPKDVSSNSEILAFYDFGNSESCEKFAVENEVLRGLGGEAWLAAGNVRRRELAKFGPSLADAHWLPDGMVLEMEWQSRADDRKRMEKLRSELSTSIDGEVFLEAARRAVWLSNAIQKRGSARLLYACGADEALIAWLVNVLSDVPFAVALERSGVFSGKVKKRILGAASAVAIVAEEDALMREVPAKETKKLGPIRWKVEGREASLNERRDAFRTWISGALG